MASAAVASGRRVAAAIAVRSCASCAGPSATASGSSWWPAVTLSGVSFQSLHTSASLPQVYSNVSSPSAHTAAYRDSASCSQVSIYASSVFQGMVGVTASSHTQTSLLAGRPKLVARRFSAAAADLPPHQEITMPSLSPTMTQGNIATWRKAEGDKVAAGDVIAEIETDKATLEMESMEDGVLAKILVPAGAKDVPVGQPIAILAESGDDIAAFASYVPAAPAASEAPPAAAPPPAAAAPAATPAAAAAPPPPPPAATPAAAAAPPPPPKAPSATSAGPRVFASPLARALAAEHGIKLSNITGSGPGGRIVRGDVEKAIGSGTVSLGGGAVLTADGEYVDIPNSNIRRITAQRLLESKTTVPHFYLSVDVNVDGLSKLRAEFNAAQAAKGGKKISVNDFIVKAAALALKKVPGVNAAWSTDYIRQYSNVDVSVAVQTEHGLLVPVIRDADKLGLEAISSTVKDLAAKAKSNTLKPAEFTGGTFTISNLGMYGIKSFSAIINPPQGAILAVGGTDTRVVKTADGFAPAKFMTVTLSCDHRVIDGAVGAEWLGAFKKYVEDPITMLL